MEKAEAETLNRVKMARSAPKKHKEPTSPLRYGFDIAVEKAVTSFNRIFKKFTEAQRQQALAAVMDRLGAITGSDKLPKRTVEAQPGSYELPLMTDAA